jgi:hypothetical protein
MEHKNNNAQIKWNKKKYENVMKEFNISYEISIKTGHNIFYILKKNKGDFRRYYLSDHYYNLRKNFKWFINYEEQIRMEIEREYLQDLSPPLLNMVYLSIINNSYLK